MDVNLTPLEEISFPGHYIDQPINVCNTVSSSDIAHAYQITILSTSNKFSVDSGSKEKAMNMRSHMNHVH